MHMHVDGQPKDGDVTRERSVFAGPTAGFVSPRFRRGEGESSHTRARHGSAHWLAVRRCCSLRAFLFLMISTVHTPVGRLGFAGEHGRESGGQRRAAPT